MNNREAFEEAYITFCKSHDGNWSARDLFYGGYDAALTSQAQQPAKLPPEWGKNVSRMWQCVRKHDCDIPSDDLDLMRQILLQSQAHQTESQWISVDEAKAALKDGDLLYVAFQNGDVSEAVYRWEQGYYPHRITSEKYGNERLEICTHVMQRKPTSLPPTPEVDDNGTS